MPLPCVVDEIRRLSQQEGMNDSEIADYLGCSRATVNRTRKQHNIPKANLINRQDKRFRCGGCGKETLIRRGAPRRLYCKDCEDALGITPQG